MNAFSLVIYDPFLTISSSNGQQCRVTGNTLKDTGHTTALPDIYCKTRWREIVTQVPLGIIWGYFYAFSASHVDVKLLDPKRRNLWAEIMIGRYSLGHWRKIMSQVCDYNHKRNDQICNWRPECNIHGAAISKTFCQTRGRVWEGKGKLPKWLWPAYAWGKSWLSWRLMVVSKKWKSRSPCSLSSSVQIKKASKATNWALRMSFLSFNISQWIFFSWKVIGLGQLFNIFWPHLFVKREMKDGILGLSQGPWEPLGLGCSWCYCELER